MTWPQYLSQQKSNFPHLTIKQIAKKWKAYKKQSAIHNPTPGDRPPRGLRGALAAQKRARAVVSRRRRSRARSGRNRDRAFARSHGLDVVEFMKLPKKDRDFIRDQQKRSRAAKRGRKYEVFFSEYRGAPSDAPVFVSASSPEEALKKGMTAYKKEATVDDVEPWDDSVGYIGHARVVKGDQVKLFDGLHPLWAKANPAVPTALQVGGVAALGFTAWRFWEKRKLRQQLLELGGSEADVEKLIADNYSFFSLKSAASLLKEMGAL